MVTASSRELAPLSHGPTAADRVRIVRGAAAGQLLDEPGFREQWIALHRACPWSTPYQGAPFACTWYDVYREVYEPVVVYAGDGRALDGLLLLAADRRGSAVAHVGTQHAEYQTWLARPEASDAFIVAALDALRQACARQCCACCSSRPGHRSGGGTWPGGPAPAWTCAGTGAG